jgi:ATP-dependent Clp protease ATP-binding subunit ClpB
VLLDEIEKAAKDVTTVLLQVLDEGFLTNIQGTKKDFRNTLVVMNSNLGTDILISDLGGSSDNVTPEQKKDIMQVVQHSYAPEILNCIGEFIVFNKLSKTALREIVDIRIKELQARLDDREWCSTSLRKSKTGYARKVTIRGTVLDHSIDLKLRLGGNWRTALSEEN